MTKEEIFEELKSLIDSLIDTSRLKEDPNFGQEWVKRQTAIGVEINKLNSCDAVWLNDHYGEWIKGRVKSHLDKLPPIIKDNLDWQ